MPAPRLPPSTFEELREPLPVIESIPTNTYQSTNAYGPSTGFDPYGNKDADLKKLLINAELKGFWTLERASNPRSRVSLWDEFFPDGEDGERCLRQLKEAGIFLLDPASKCNPDMRKWKGRWKAMPTPSEKDVSDEKKQRILEKDITKVFVPIVNHIISSLHLADNRVAVDGQDFKIRTRDRMWLKPDVFIWGRGSPALPHIDGKPKPKPDPRSPRMKASMKAPNNAPTTPSTVSPARSSKRLSKKQRVALPDETVTQSTQSKFEAAEAPHIDWPWCCVPIEIKTSKGRTDKTLPLAFAQLGSYVREVFAAQTHRRFVPSLLLTESRVEFLLWDRAGVVVSERMDYHAQPLRFCSMLASLVKWNDQQLGFDPTIFYQNNELHIRTGEAIETSDTVAEYVVEETLYRAYTLRGRGSTCWRAHRLGNEDDHYVIQDSWVEVGMGVERDILLKVEAARVGGRIAGVAPFIHIEDVMMPGTDSYSDSTKSNRRHDNFAGVVDLVHTRTVLRCNHDCASMERFTSPQEFTNTLHDVLKGLGEMHAELGIIHRDIVPWNILMQPEAPEGSRGILIDFSCATFTNSKLIRRRPEKTPGCNPFMPQNALMGMSANSHVDELESFYWVLVFIACLHAGPGLTSSRNSLPPAAIRLLESPGQDAAAVGLGKLGYLKDDFAIPVHPWFKKPMERLVKNLHGFLQCHLKGQLDSTPAQGYEAAVSYFRQAMTEFEQLIGMDDANINDANVNDEPAPEAEAMLEDGQVEESHGLPDTAGKRSRGEKDEGGSTRLRKKMRLQIEFEIQGDLLVEGSTIYIGAENNAVKAISNHRAATGNEAYLLPLASVGLDSLKNAAQEILNHNSQMTSPLNNDAVVGTSLERTRNVTEMSVTMARIDFS